jgi:predicted HTH transcriptional regulator
MEAKVYDFVKAKGKATREEVMKNFGLSGADLKAQLVTLMHAELVKERAERGKMYLVPIG